MTDILQSHLNKLRKDKFLAVISLPNILKELNRKNIVDNQLLNLDSLQFGVVNCTIPTISIPEISLMHSGQNYNATSYVRPKYDPIKLDFQVDNEFKNYWVIWKWLNLMNDAKNSTYASTEMYPNGAPVQQPPIVYNYTTDMSLYGLNEYDKKVIRFDFKYTFPTSLGQLDYNYQDSEQLSTSATFVFNQLHVELITDNGE